MLREQKNNLLHISDSDEFIVWVYM